MSAFTVQGVCPTCRGQRLSVNGDTKCLKCDIGPSAPTGPLSKYSDPGEQALQAVSARSNVRIAVSEKGANGITSSQKIAPPRQSITLEECVAQALSILGSAPMPKDIKQFKSIQKVIKTLEGLVEK